MSTTSRRTARPGARLRKTVLGTGVTLVLAGMNMPAAIGFTQDRLHEYRISRPEYRAEYGSWALVDVPERYRTNAIHAALLHTGKVMLIAGSGNDQQEFDAGTFETVLWDPSDNTWTEVETPDDLFCAGHSQLADGRLLVAGGTARYELLGDQVTRAGGGMIVKNENPDREHTFPAGTVFRSPDGVAYETEIEFTLPPATKEERVEAGGDGEDAETTTVEITASETRVFVVAVEEGEGSVNEEPTQYSIDGLTGEDADNVYGLAESLTLEDQDFHGIKAAYEFDPVAERYIPVDPMAEARWYPTLTTLPDGRVLTVSGLDDIGEVVPGINEIYDPETQTWEEGPERYFPTYPALFLAQGGKIFYTGSNAGYGPADEGREPGIWDLETNTFTEVGGLRDADQLETSASLLLPPAQEQRFMVLGGGGVGESEDSTPRTAVIDLTEAEPRYRDAAELPQGTRYLNSVIMPDDTVFTTGGSEDYRGRGRSDILKAQFYDPATDTFRPAADPTVPRNYHAEALLLPDGRVATFGSDPLFADADNTRMGRFEQRVEVYTPPALYRAETAAKDGVAGRPVIEDGPREPARGAESVFRVPDAERIGTARLIRPSAVTHTTDVEQRSIAVEITAAEGDELTLDIPEDRSLTPPGWYMLFVTDGGGAFSEAHWVHLP